MKRILFLFTIPALIVATAQAQVQTFEVPANYELKQPPDYAKH